MLTGVHFLLTYTCNYECDHCFVYGSPRAAGTFTLNQVRQVMEELPKIGTIRQVFFEGGEAFLYYPLMVEGIRIARENGFDAGIVTNAYWATAEEDAELWLKALVEAGISKLVLSDDSFHSESPEVSPARHALAAAEKSGIPVSVISIEEPRVEIASDEPGDRGEPVVRGSTMFKGRAVEKLTEGLPTRNWKVFTECPHEDLRNPQRVHIDSYGNVHLCQGLSMGNMWRTPFSELVSNYDCDSHPVCRLLVEGGPARLAREYGIEDDAEYVDECHLCYTLRKRLIDKFPDYLCPGQVYGL